MSFRRILVFSAVLVAACDSRIESMPEPLTLQVIRTDAARNRLWVLERDALSLHDARNGRRLKRFVLPDWVLAGPAYACAPDLAIAPDGAAIVSSNVLPVLWRVDPQRLEVTTVELALASDAGREVGFTRLSFDVDGTILASGATYPSLWRLDLVSARAVKVESYPPTSPACELAPRA